MLRLFIQHASTSKFWQYCTVIGRNRVRRTRPWLSMGDQICIFNTIGYQSNPTSSQWKRNCWMIPWNFPILFYENPRGDSWGRGWILLGLLQYFNLMRIYLSGREGAGPIWPNHNTSLTKLEESKHRRWEVEALNASTLRRLLLSQFWHGFCVLPGNRSIF